MKKEKGFTLIELLAVILILAIIALIAIPIVSKLIKNARDQADLRSAETYAKAGEDYYATASLKKSESNYLGVNIIDRLKIKGTKASGIVQINNSGKVDMAIVIHDKCYTKTSEQGVKDISVSNDKNNCALGGSGIYASILTRFPELEVGENGCKNPSEKNYSYIGGCYLAEETTQNTPLDRIKQFHKIIPDELALTREQQNERYFNDDGSFNSDIFEKDCELYESKVNGSKNYYINWDVDQTKSTNRTYFQYYTNSTTDTTPEIYFKNHTKDNFWYQLDNYDHLETKQYRKADILNESYFNENVLDSNGNFDINKYETWARMYMTTYSYQFDDEAEINNTLSNNGVSTLFEYLFKMKYDKFLSLKGIDIDYNNIRWQILGINKDKTVKLMSRSSILTNVYSQSGNSNFINSDIETLLNNTIFNQLANNSAIANGTWCQATNSYTDVNQLNASSNCNGTTFKDKVGLITYDEYKMSNPSITKKDLYDFWTLTPIGTNKNAAVFSNYYSSNYEAWDVTYVNTMWTGSYRRPYAYPVINIKSDTPIKSGDGYLFTPYKI